MATMATVQGPTPLQGGHGLDVQFVLPFAAVPAQSAQCLAAPAGHREVLIAQRGDGGGTGKQHAIGSTARSGGEAGEHTPRCLRADLLTHDTAYRGLIQGPVSRCANTGKPLQQRCQPPVLPQHLVDCRRVGIQVEHASHPGHDGQQQTVVRQLQLQSQGVFTRHGADLETAGRTAQRDVASVTPRRDELHPGDGVAREEVRDALPVVGWAVVQLQLYAGVGGRYAASAAQCTGRQPELFLHGAVKTPHAAKTGGKSHISHRQCGLRQQLLGEQQALVERQRLRRYAQFALEQFAQVALADSQPQRQVSQRSLVERALAEQLQRALYCGGSAVPGRAVGGGLGAAAQAGSKTGLGRQGGAAKVTDIFLRRRPRRADRPAVDPRGPHGQVEFAVEAGIARHPGPAAHLGIEARLKAQSC